MPPPPPSITGEVYCFPRRQLIFSFDRRVLYHLKGLWEYIPKSIPSVCPSVCTTILKRIAGFSFYFKCLFLTSMDSSEQALQKKWIAFFHIFNSFSNFWPKTENYSKEWRGVFNDQIAMCYISMDSSQRAVQTNEKLISIITFRNFGLIYIELY